MKYIKQTEIIVIVMLMVVLLLPGLAISAKTNNYVWLFVLEIVVPLYFLFLFYSFNKKRNGK